MFGGQVGDTRWRWRDTDRGSEDWTIVERSVTAVAEDCGRRIRVGARPKEAINYLEDYTEAENPKIQIAKGETGGRGDVSHIELGFNYLLSGQLDISEICQVLQRTLGRRSKSTFIHCIMVQRSINLYRE